MKNIAVVTGADSGLGLEFVKLLLNRDDLDEIRIIARNGAKLERMVSEYGPKLKPCPMDLSDRNNIRTFADTLKNADVNVSLLINNAGFAKFGVYDDVSPEVSANMIDLNVTATVLMGLVCIPFMQPGAHIINIASQAAFQPVPYQNVYSSTKAFVRNYSRALNVELKGRGITVTAVCPGWMRTNLFDRADIGAEKATRYFPHMASPKAVAEKALRDASANRDMSVYGAYVKFCHVGAKLLPQRLIMKIWSWQQKLP